MIDLRMNAARSDLADARLEGVTEAGRYVAGEDAVASAPWTALRARPDPAAAYVAGLVMGEPVRLFDDADGWAWAQSLWSGYVGYAPSSAVSPAAPPGAGPMLRVRAPRAHFYQTSNPKTAPVGWAPFGARFCASSPLVDAPSCGRDLIETPLGFVSPAAVALADDAEADWVSAAERLIGTAYVWGGDGPDGIDCSGLVLRARQAAGCAFPRDSDQQEAFSFAADDPAARGDLIFWDGHVGVLIDAEMLLHANLHHMAVAVEPLIDAEHRIAAGGGGASRRKRPLDAALSSDIAGLMRELRGSK